MSDATRQPSARQVELLEAAYAYVLEHGLVDLSLRPLAAAIGSSPRVLMFLFGSKDQLVQALLDRARADELALLADLGAAPDNQGQTLRAATEKVWSWLREPARRPLLRMWTEAYGRSLVEPEGPWAGFARATVNDWLAVLSAWQPPDVRSSPSGEAARTLTLAVLRGCLLDLLATEDEARVSAALRRHLDHLD